MADYSITPSDVIADSSGLNRDIGVSGEAFEAGDLLYRSGGVWSKAQADDVATSAVLGMALSTAEAAGQYFVYADAGNVALGVGSAGDIAVLSAGSAGGLAPSADLVTGNYVTTVGTFIDDDGTVKLQLGISVSRQAKA